MKKSALCILLLIILFAGCKTEQQTNLKYIFIGHCYRWHEGPDKVDKRITKIDFSKFDEIWLGGDLCSETAKDLNTLYYLDSIFDIKSSKTYWALGNHDTRNGHIDQITEFIKRKTYYASYSNGITKIVLNTCFNNVQVKILQNSCNELEKQYSMICNVTDTISKSDYLILLMHSSVWTGLESEMINKANLNLGSYEFRCDSASTFNNLIYPMLVKVRKRGITVICISGDYGQKDKAFEYITNDSIVLLGSGINNSILSKPESLSYYPYVTNTSDPDSILILNYNIVKKELTWNFYNLNNYVNNNKK